MSTLPIVPTTHRQSCGGGSLFTAAEGTGAPDHYPRPTMEGTTVVDLDGVVAVLGGYPALAGVTLTIAAGEIVLLRGPNGAGKTTLLRVCAGLLPIARGTGTVLGCDLAGERDEVRRRVGLLGHRNGLYLDLTVSRERPLLGGDDRGDTGRDRRGDATPRSLGQAG